MNKISYHLLGLAALLTTGVIRADDVKGIHKPTTLWQNLKYQSECSGRSLSNVPGIILPVAEPEIATAYVDVRMPADVQKAPGVRHIPYKEEFTDETSFSDFTVADNDRDGCTWHFVSEEDYFTGKTNGYAKIFINSENIDHRSDDWLLTPPVSLKSGKTYNLAFKVSGFDGCNDTFDVYVGSATEEFNPDSYREVLPPQALISSESQEYSIPFGVDADGNYSIAFHYTSSFQDNGFFMILDDIGIDEGGTGGEVPGGVADMSVVPDESGELQAEISFFAPCESQSGEALTSISSIALVRDNELIHTFENPAVSEHLSFKDTTPPRGYVKYTAIPYNDGGRGEAVSMTAYVGEDVPRAPKEVRFIDNLDGTATLSWLSPGNIGENGERVNESKLCYSLYTPDNMLIEDSLRSTKLDITDVPAEGEQSLARIRVAAKSAAGEGMSTLSTELITGKPFTLPYYESFPKGQQSHCFYWQEGNCQEKFKPTETMSSDGDGGCIFWTALDHNENISFCFGKISIEESSSPMMSFSYYAVPDQDIEIDVEIDNPAHIPVMAGHVDYKELLGKEGWRRVMIDLSDYKNNAYIVPKIKCSGEGALSYSIVLDDFRFFDVVDHDLAVTLMDNPVKAHTGDSIDLQVRIDNHGLAEASGYDVVLRSGERELKRIEGVAINAMQYSNMTLPFTVPSEMNGLNELTVEIAFPGDVRMEDNEVSFNLEIAKTDLPAVEGLSYQIEESDIVLTWESPEGKGCLRDDFSFYTPFSTSNFGRWNTIDADGGQTLGIGHLDYPHRNDPKAFMIFNPEYAGVDLEENPAFASECGGQYLMSFCSEIATTKDGYTSDWLISPLVAFGAGNVKLRAGAFWDNLGGDILLYSSNSGNRKEDFINFGKLAKVRAGFEEFEFAVPEDTKYFALEFLPQNNGALLLDEISYWPEYLEVKGYRIYRDNEPVATVGADTKIYREPAPAESGHEYMVSALYGEGESLPSEKLTIDISGISDSCQEGISIHSRRGGIVINNAGRALVSIASSCGMTIYESRGEDTVDLELPQGIYIVRIDNTTYKTYIK